MAILTAPDKEKIKRAVPKASNKIIDSTVARLYIAYPDPTKWVYTGLSGAVTLVDDLVGHTFFLKLVDIVGHRGVIWDQELYIDFEYHQDRSFFHTFELEDALAGLLFDDSSDASHFYKRVTHKEKYGSKQTLQNKNAIALKKEAPSGAVAPGPRGEYVDVNTNQRTRRAKGVIYYDDLPPPEWRSLYAELDSAGITEDMIADNRQFIKDYISQQGGPLVGLEPPIPRKYQNSKDSSPLSRNTSTATKSKKAPPPPPPSQINQDLNVSTPDMSDNDGTFSGSSSPAPEYSPAPAPQSRFKVPPPPTNLPPVRQPPPEQQQQYYQSYQSQQLPQRNAVPPPPVSRNQGRAVPPPPQRASNGPPLPPLPNQQRPMPGVPHPNGPSLPPRIALQAGQTQTPQFGSQPPPPPPPRAGRPVPPTPRRGLPPALPPARVSSLPAGDRIVPPPPQQQYSQPPPQQQQQYQSPPPQHQYQLPPQQQQYQPPPSISPSSRPAAQIPISNTAPPPAPPAPPMPPMGMPNLGSSDTSAPIPAPDPNRNALLASIRGAGVGGLKKVDKSQLDKPSVILQEAKGATSGSGGAPGQPASLADALAVALNKRKNKVAHSDNEDEDW